MPKWFNEEEQLEIAEIVEKTLARPVTLKYKLLTEDAKPPKMNHQGDSCFDVYATSISAEANYLEYGTGVCFSMPTDYELKVYPRSSISTTSLILANSVGVIDEGYKGELMIRFKTVAPYKGMRYIIGDRIAQVQLVKKVPTILQEVDELGSSTRGTGGFGSTGKK